MARAITIVADHEDIYAVEHHYQGNFVRVLIGPCAVTPDGTTVYLQEQNLEQYIIQDEAYAALLAATDIKPGGVFRKDDLWPFVDIGRQNVAAERQAIADAEAAKIAAQRAESVALNVNDSASNVMKNMVFDAQAK